MLRILQVDKGRTWVPHPLNPQRYLDRNSHGKEC